jgi:siroheme synthase (precorrin-2 oxidase/ferrochelatase)
MSFRTHFFLQAAKLPDWLAFHTETESISVSPPTVTCYGDQIMKIVVVGDGKVGFTLANQLSAEGHNITIIDNNPETLRRSMEAHDVIGIRGNGLASPFSRRPALERPILSLP